jgi:group I intron endonuclease
MKGCIYKITCVITSKIYIGQTIDYNRRKANYKKLNCSSQTKLYNSISKYGWENHLMEIIEECIEEELGKREKYWKTYFNSVEKGLNIRYDEEKGGKLDKSICLKISNAKKGCKYSKESSIKKSQALTGKKKSKEHKNNISKAKKGIPNSNKGLSKPKEFGEKISNNKERNKKISESHKGKSHPRTQEWSNKIGKSNKKPILQFDLKDVFIKEWESAKDAALFMGINPSPITACCKKKQKTCYNFKWKYKNE